MLKRFMLCGGEIYYASGGMQDFIKSFDDVDTAVAEAERLVGSNVRRVLDEADIAPFTQLQWWHVFDQVEFRIVAQGETRPY